MDSQDLLMQLEQRLACVDRSNERAPVAQIAEQVNAFNDRQQLNSNACECLFNISGGFLVNEDYKVKVLKNKNVLFTENVSTTESIKPKKPFIVSVNQTQDGNFHIEWDTEYKEPVFSSDLISELTYYVEGNKERRKNVTLNKGKQDYLLVGRNLESNSNYTVRARIRSNLNLIFSDYSDPYWFTTPPSPNNNLKIIIPIICVILIICIFTMYYCYDKLGSSLVEVRGENSLNSLGKDGSSSEVVYDQTGNESVEDNNAHWELVKESQPTNLRQTNLMSTKYLKNMKPNSDDIQRERGNSFRFTNKFYMFSGSNELPKATMGFFDDRNKKEHVFSVGPCTGCLGSKNTSILDCAPTDKAFISIPNNVNLIMEKQMCSPQNISCETAIIEVENGYKDFQSLLRNSEEQQSLACESELKHLCGPVLHTPPEHNLNLECINDYLTEMMCILTPVQLDSCPEYSLNASRDNLLFTCDFKQLNSNACECLFNVSSGFVVNEDYKVKVLKNKNVLFTENISTTESIKPKKPFIVSVNQTQDGNFYIEWDTEYTTKEPVFSSDLISELTYYVEGNKESRKCVTLNKGKQDYLLVGRNLESNSNYTVRARIQSNLNLIFSDYSDPYWFTTPPSPNEYLKIIIPIICVILIICVFSMYYYYDRLGSSLGDVRDENSLNSLGKDGSSSEVVYGQTGNESVEDSNAHWELVQESQSTNLRQTNLMPNKYYKNMKPNHDDIQRDSGSSSGFSNKFYMFSVLDELPKPTMGFFGDINQKENVFLSLAKTQDPVIQTDFEYGPCTGWSGSENTSPTQFTPSSNEIIMVPAYQSVNEVIDCAPTDQAFISSHNDVNLIMEKQMCSPQNISCETGIIQVENGYKDFQSLLRNSEEQQSLACEPELKRLCGPVLHTPPGIQIDSSYHRV
ncbi:hypothetical protein C0J50_17576 [Silurus asotus]|uniref:Fibronectin type-III domain-containing protein n=1 Tax=Silurus asotus TaxID=30991 RepID=A0AAD5ATU1_SILAS|nr:hypothetical protein C0J50_17576 [Silurus asotus]